MVATDVVYFEAVLCSESGKSMFERDTPLLGTTLDQFQPEPGRAQSAARELTRLGFTVRHIGTFSISGEGPKALFEQVFSTQLAQRQAPTHDNPQSPKISYWSHVADTPFILPGNLVGLISRVYPQRPAQLLGHCHASPLPPAVAYHHLRVPDDIATVLRAHQPHRQGITGSNILVAMPDTGFFKHPFYATHGYRYKRMLTPGVTNLENDEIGHGTAEAANIFACAPDVNFIGIKMHNDPTLSFKTTMDLRPQIITCSWGQPLNGTEDTLPNYLRPLETVILEAIHHLGITVCFSAGNGDIMFPGMMPDVISVGGVYAHANFDGDDFKLEASNFASAFTSKIYPGRQVPDFCGLVGQKPYGHYIALPVEPEDEMDRGGAQPGGNVIRTFPYTDETRPNDGWTVTSGTSAAAPQIAGVCALMKQINPDLSPALMKTILKASCRDVKKGVSNSAENLAAGPGHDQATGAGLIDATLACELARATRNTAQLQKSSQN